MAIAAYTSATGLTASQVSLDVTGNNLANVSTTGYKVATVNFQDLIYDGLGAGSPVGEDQFTPTGTQTGNGVSLAAVGGVFTQGAIQPSTGPLDVAVSGQGFFQVTQLDGTVAYTRDGTFTLDSSGQIVTADGLPVVGPTAAPAGTTQVTIGSDGTVTAVAADGTMVPLGQITLARFVNPPGLLRVGDNLFLQTPAAGDAQTGAPGTAGLGLLQPGALEGSNVDVTRELINLLLAQRSFSFNADAFRVSTEILQQTAQLVGVS